MRPLAEELVNRVRELLATGLSQRVVSQMTGVSRGTVGKIAAGTYPDYARLRRQREMARLPGTGPVDWCAACRRFVPMPCVKCAAIKARDEAPRQEQAFLDTLAQDTLEPDLRDEHQTAYEQIHSMKIRQDSKNSPLRAGPLEIDEDDEEQGQEPPELAILAGSSPEDARRRLAAALAREPNADRRARSA